MVLEGGIPLESVSLIYGEAETGKTTLAMQLAINYAKQAYKTLFIDCDGTFSARRLSQIAGQNFKEIAELIRSVVGYEGQLRFDLAKPDGMPLKALDSSKLRAMGWRPQFSLRSGLEETYRWFHRWEEKPGPGVRPRIRGKNKVTGKGRPATLR